MRASLSIISFLFILHSGLSKKNIDKKSFARWVVERNSSINIQGETNVNNFQCDVTEFLKPDTLIYTLSDSTKKLSFTKNCLTIDLRRFDCHNRYFTEDFRSALKADEDPDLKILFLTLDQFSNSSALQKLKGIIEIELARTIKRVEIDCIVKKITENRVQVIGGYVFSFSDFNLKAPRKLAGLIRTKERIKVNYQLFFKTI